MSKERYLVTARKYRPQRFDELVAQEHVAHTLKNALRFNRLAHAYLFSGPRGVGKTTAARILAKAINCTGPGDEVEPCRTCGLCKDFEEQRSLSIFEIDAASNNKVEDVRELRETVRIPPQEAKKKVYIIDEVHMLSNAAFNALLKTLEEPPPHVLFIFATTEPHKVLPTILSRCQRFDFRRIPVPAIVEHLKSICENEQISADEESLLLIARKGDGALRDALSAFDQAIALCGTDLQYAELAAALRVVDTDNFFESTEHVAARSSDGMLRLAERLMTGGHDIREFLAGMAEHVRNLLVAVTIGDEALIDVSGAVRERYQKHAESFTETTLLRLLMIIDQTQSTLADAASPRLKLELALVKMTRLGDSIELSAAVAQLRRIEHLAKQGAIGTGGATHSAPRPPQSAHSQSRTPQPSASAGSRTSSVQPAQDSGMDPVQSKASRQESTKERHRLDQVETSVLGKPALSQPSSSSTSAPSNRGPVPETQSHSQVKDGAALWDSVAARLAQSDPSMAPVMPLTQFLQWKGNQLAIAVRDDLNRHLVSGKQAWIVEMLSEVTGRTNLRLSFELRPELFPAAVQKPAEQLEALQKKHPTVKALVDHLKVVPVPNQHT